MKAPFIPFVLSFLVSLAGFPQQKDQLPKKKETAAVLDFKATQGISTSETVTLTNKFRSALAKTQVYDVLERSDMETLLKEQDMSLSDMCDNADCAVQVGKLLVAKKMVVGEIGKIGETFSVTVRILDVTTGKVDIAETENYKGSADGLLDVFYRLAQKLTGTYQSPKTWYYVGGAVVIGGAAILLLPKKSSGSSGIADPIFPPQ